MKKVTNDLPETLNAEWVLSDVCNYKCAYCHPIHYDKTSGFPDVEESLEFWNFIHSDINSNKKLLLLSGGEPTLWPGLSKFINGLNPAWRTEIVTNGSRTLRWWKKFLDETDIKRVTISVHLEFATPEHIIEVSRLCAEKCYTTALILFDKSKIPEAKDMINKIVESNIKIDMMVKPITNWWTNGKVISYEEKDLDFIKGFKYGNSVHTPLDVSTHLVIDDKDYPVQYGGTLIANKQNTFKGWRCEAGSKRLVVWHDGNVYGAQCSTAKKHLLGNIKDKKIKKIESIICQNEYCDCIPDIRIPKWREDVRT
jgi:MoaA/NifB/PqqE/SkfB family radical SAM enzyme